MYSIISFLSENLYYMIVVGVVIALAIFFIVGSIKQKRQQQIIEEERMRNKIDAPVSNKRFIQGEVIEKQKIITPTESEETNNE